MSSRAATGFLLAVIVMAAGAHAEEPSILAPFRFQEADTPLNKIDTERALIYRTQLQSQLRTLDRKEALGRLDGDRLLKDTRTEAQRLDRILSQPAQTGPHIPQSVPLPSLSTGLGRGSP